MDATATGFARPIVVLNGISKRWPSRRVGFRGKMTPAQEVLTDIELTVERSQIFAVLGENGAGKTTLLKVIAGLAREDAGTVELLGETAGVRVDEIRRTRVGYSAGERGFYFRLTVRENLRFFGTLDGMGKLERQSRIEQVMELCHLSSHAEKRFSDLSSGFRQRVAIARALLSDADILLLDEPTRTIDPLHALLLRTFIREELANERKRAVIVATNQLEEAHFLGDAAGIIRNTRLHPIFDRTTKPETLDLAQLFPGESFSA